MQKELGAYFQQNGNALLQGKMITVTVVRVSPDLSHAKVYLSIFPSNDKENALKKIREKESSIRRHIGRQIKNQVRNIPEFSYFIDDSLDYIDNIDEILNET